MKNKFSILALIILGTAQSSFSMPCDSGYACQSKSGKYHIEVQRCRYVNRLGNLSSVQVDGQEVTDATLGSAWDGKSVGDSLLAFEINLPSDPGSSHVLSVEIPTKTKGIIKEKYAAEEPGPYTVVHHESIACKVVE